MIESLISVGEMGRILGKSAPAIRQMRWRGGLPDAIKIGKKLFWSESDIKRFLKECKIERKKGEK